MDARSLAGVATTAALATAGGLLGEWTGVPAGALLGAMLAVAGYNLWTNGRARLPAPIRSGSRILAGTTIGSLATGTLLSELGTYLVWVILATVVIIGAGLGSAWVLTRLTSLPMSTTLLACAPGGVAEMAALADDLDADTELVVGMHVLRKLVVLVTISAIVLALMR
jgi:uncharacterized protein